MTIGAIWVKIKQGWVYMAYLDPTLGSEQKGRRPVLVVSPDVIQNNLHRAIVVPFTTQDRGYPTFVPVSLKGSTSYAMLDQLRTIDGIRFKNEITQLDDKDMDAVMSKLREMFG